MIVPIFKKRDFDERFVMHRLRSTRLAMVVLIIMMGTWVNYEWFVNHTMRPDLLIMIGVTVLVKVGAMIYHRLTD
jgi:hypothetical protein